MNPSPQFNNLIPASAPNPNGKIGAMLGRKPGPNKKENVGRMGPTRMPDSFRNKKA